MHITLETDYAIRIVDCLAQSKTRMGAQSISEQCDVTLRFALKILRKLVASGMIRSYKGVQGGYEMARPLEEINMYEILETIEGPYVFSRCLNPGHDCHRNLEGSPCVFHQHYIRISEMVREELANLSFDKLLQQKKDQSEELLAAK